MFRRWSRPVSIALAVLTVGCLVGDRALATSVDAGDAPPSVDGPNVVASHVLETSPVVVRPTFLRTILVAVGWGPALDHAWDAGFRPQGRTVVELDAVLIAVAVSSKYLPFQQSLRAP